jgi:multicomponent K+:H+ antiporter subunit E
MSRILPFPLVSLGLLVFWLLLNQALSPGHILLGGAVALAGGWGLSFLDMPQGRAHHPGAVLRLSGRVLADIFRSNIAVGRILLGFGRRQRRSGFVQIPLKLRNPYGVATLACIITSTPGTLWVSLDRATGMLMIHVLDLTDPEDWVRTVQDRYERLLLEIFE